MTNYSRRPQRQWSGATGGIVRCKRVSTEYARKSGSGRVLRSTCGEKLKPKDGTRPSKPCMRRAQDKNNPASLLQSRPNTKLLLLRYLCVVAERRKQCAVR